MFYFTINHLILSRNLPKPHDTRSTLMWCKCIYMLNYRQNIRYHVVGTIKRIISPTIVSNKSWQRFHNSFLFKNISLPPPTLENSCLKIFDQFLYLFKSILIQRVYLHIFISSSDVIPTRFLFLIKNLWTHWYLTL